MNFDLQIYLAAWAVLTTVVVCLAVYRWTYAKKADKLTLHLRPAEGSLVSRQADAVRALDVIDRWGKALTVISFLSGLAIGLAYVWPMLP